MSRPGWPAALAWALLTSLAGFATAAEPEEGAKPELQKYELKVVGVYRSVELQGRTVATPREVYLQPLSASGPIDALVGQTLDVHRRVPVPASIDFVEKPGAAKAGDKKSAKKQRKPRRRPRKRIKPEEATRLGAGAKPAAKPAAAAAAAAPAGERVARPGARPVKTAPMEVKVGQVKVVAVRSGVVVAQAVETMGAPSAVGGAVPAVMAGDLARLELRPPAPPPPPSLSAAEQSVLDADRKVTEKEDHRRRHPPKKYKRAKMRWKL